MIYAESRYVDPVRPSPKLRHPAGSNGKLDSSLVVDKRYAPIIRVLHRGYYILDNYTSVRMGKLQVYFFFFIVKRSWVP